jgi:hypothetical protein
MINLVVSEILFPLRMLLLIGSLVQLLGGTVLSHVVYQSTLETCTKSLTSLRGGILLLRGCRMRNMLYILPGLLHDWADCLLLGMGQWKSRRMRLKVGTLHQELGTLILKLQTWNLHRQVAQKWGPDKLTRLQKAVPSVASRMPA